MALVPETGVIPKGAVRMSPGEALSHQWKMIANWKPRREVWPFTYGIGSLVGAGAVSGIMINTMIQKRMKTFAPHTRLMFVTLAITPSLLAGALHSELVTHKILLLMDFCPPCLETKAAFFQTVSGIAYPIIFSALMNIRVAYVDGHRGIPVITDLKNVGKYAVKMLKPLIPQFTIMFAAHTFLAYYITHCELKSFRYVHNRLLFLEEHYNTLRANGNNSN